MMRTLLHLLFLFPIVCLGAQWPIPPVTISTPGVNASFPRAAVDVNGNIIAVWLENTTVMSSSTVVKGIWSVPVSVSASGAANPRVVMDVHGTATAIWSENGIIKVATKPLAGSWSTSTAISSGSGASMPQMSVDASGDLVAVWMQDGAIMSSTRLFNGSWNVIADTLSLGAGASFPRLAMNGSGAVVVVWQQPISSISTIYAAQKQVNGIWGVAVPISSAGTNSGYPRVAMDNDGNVTAVWFQYQYANNQYSNVFFQVAQAVGQVWSAPMNVSSTASLKNPADFSVSMSYNGTDSPVVTWTSSDDGTTFNIEQAGFIEGAWEMHPQLLTHNWGAYGVSLGIGPIGNNGTVWMRFEPISGKLIIEGTSTTYDGFEDLVWARWIFSNGGNNAYPVTVAGGTIAAPAGVLIWESSSGANTTIQAITSALKVVQPPTGVSVVQQGTNFDVLTRYDNVLSWTASVSKNLWGYVIERNNLPLAMVISTNLSYTDINQDQNAPVTYKISTVDINGFQSEWVSVSLP